MASLGRARKEEEERRQEKRPVSISKSMHKETRGERGEDGGLFFPVP